MLRSGDLLTIDGTSGAVIAGHARTTSSQRDDHLDRLLEWTDDITGAPPGRLAAHERLAAAHAVIDRA